MRLCRSIIIVVVVLAGISCSSRKSEIDRKNMVPQEKMVDIITDLYLTDGLIMQPRVRDWYSPADTLAAYTDVIHGHGVDRDDFDRTLRFYFIKKPKKLLRIYDLALARLSELEKRSEQEMLQMQERISNLWNKSRNYVFPESADSLHFNTLLPYPTTYALHFTVTLFPGEEALNPRATLFTCHPDSLSNGTRNYIETVPYVSDGHAHKYVILIRDINKNHLRLSGTLFDHENSRDDGFLRVVFEKISIGTGIGEE